MKDVHLQDTIPETLQGMRLDQALASMFPDYSRARIKTWIINQQVNVDGEVWSPTDKVKGGEEVIIHADVPEAVEWTGQEIALDVVYADDDIIIINKPAGLVVHPAAGHQTGTLVNAILHQFPECVHLPRGGIVHRLDKDTSGLMIVARSLPAHTALVKALAEHEITRKYEALVKGEMTGGGKVDAPMGRHSGNRLRMAVVEGGKHAVTHYRLKQRLPGHTLITCQLETGRTHQIRVHMAYIGYPLVGDPLYAGRARFPKNLSEKTRAYINHFKRQALHSYELSFSHPVTHEPLFFTVAMPEDMKILVRLLEEELKTPR
ncbi:MAG: 23S rRNA pseudouridine(1911/1915/1917) synthase RluD [Legionellales bacterium]|jgi:23S rRNA pseudouridine1911/1915/1917 synthase